MKPFVAYLRVSTEKQGRSGLGLEAQRDAITKFAAAQGTAIAAEYVEIETGGGADALDRRPVLREAMTHAKKIKGALVVAKLDRLSRDVHFISGLMAHKVDFIVQDLGPDVDPFMLHVYAAFAELERRKIAERTREAIARKRANGGQVGRPRHALDAERPKAIAARRAIQQSFDANVMPIIRELQAAGVKTQVEIAEKLTERGVRPPRGDTWYPNQVRRMLERAEA